ncbi:hypothetical protein V0288_16100 [Pannus brasiliensis CCIBt3594]|uniref:Uncharacterized protein n=1 Tax=Pannus brasiliensis CCIBt3594 TaxID=1427578 RepID=A0AAW9QUM4_9CHRO
MTDSKERVAMENYDRGIIPAETAARHEREGEDYKHLPEPEGEGQIDTTAGYTVDREGLLNNYAVEPEMYYETPGDAREIEEQRRLDRVEELHDIEDNDETGKLTMERDDRGRGSGLI